MALFDDLLNWSQKLGTASRRNTGPVSVQVVVDNSAQVVAALKALGRNSVLVGIPAENSPRTDNAPGNALLGYIHETGAPASNIPARPFLKPGLIASQDRWLKKLNQAGEAALAGDQKLMLQHMGEAGQIGVTAVKRTIQAGIPPPLKPRTVAKRRRRSKGSKYRRKALTPADVTPLIDTGSMINSITWVWDKK